MILYAGLKRHISLQNMATSKVEILEKKNKELAEFMEKLENGTANMNIDEAVVTTAPLYNQ